MRIHSKILLGLLSSALIIVLVMFALMQWSFHRNLRDYVEQREMEQVNRLLAELSEIYAETGSWSRLRADPRALSNRLRNLQPSRGRLERQPPGLNPPGRPLSNGRLSDDPALEDRRPGSRTQENRPQEARRFEPRRPPPRLPAILTPEKRPIIGHTPPDARLYPISYNDELVGWYAAPARNRQLEGSDLAFQKAQTIAFAIISLVVIAVCFIIAVPLARQIVKPISRITTAAKELNNGDYAIDLQVKGRDELAELATDVNHLAKTLADNEAARQRWLADISHELRTPLAIAKGEIEALLDGVRELNEDQLQSVQQEINHLEKLINDLSQLANTDIGALRYQMDHIDLMEEFAGLEHRYSQLFTERNLSLDVRLTDTPLPVYADADRIHQCLDNILGNCSKYVEDHGRVTVRVKQQQEFARISIEDSGPGVPKAAIPHLFEHLYRVDSSRNRMTGGSGLGLAICSRIITAHNGGIKARQSALGGLCIEITLPLSR